MEDDNRNTFDENENLNNAPTDDASDDVYSADEKIEDEPKENVSSDEPNPQTRDDGTYHYAHPSNGENGNPNYYNGYNQGGSNQGGYNQNSYNSNGYNPNGFSRPNINPNDVRQQPGETGRPEFNINSMPGRKDNRYSSPANGSDGEPPKKDKKKGGLIAFIVVLVLIVVLAAGLIIRQVVGTKNGNSTVKENSSTSQSDKSDSSDSIKITSSSSNEKSNATEVYEKVKKYNVGILIYSNGSLYTEGSGVLAKESEDGVYTYVITCAHVINYSGADITVLDENGKEYPAEFVGADTKTDIGVIRIKVTGLTLAEFGSADDLVVGQKIYAIGNPGGSEFFGSFTEGMISAIARPISSSTGYVRKCIQHTAAINPGNSGGALVNDKGEVIGINSMKIASTEYEGMGFAVPSDVAVEVFNSIVKNGYVAGRSKLGIKYTTPSQYSQSYAMYVQVKGLPAGSVVIAQIDEDSELSGKDVKVGDIITEIDGKKLTDTESLAAAMEGKKVGDSITLTVVRINSQNWSQTEQKITVNLVEDKGTSESETTTQNRNDANNDLYEYFKRYFGDGGYGDNSGSNGFGQMP